ncbi:transaldolase family protein [Streptomyces sp. NPDC048650]|uniref:transaldolase family protein n=1 Tax=unclassified Streptomyces TaxID=2593676 RepID=UPI0037160FC7
MTRSRPPVDRLAAEGVCLSMEGLTRELQHGHRLPRLLGELGACATAVRLAAVSQAVRHGDAYRAHLSDLACRRVSTAEAVHSLLYEDVRAACDVLLSHYRRGCRMCACVFVPLDPYADGRRALAEAAALWWTVDRPNVVVSVQLADGAMLLVGDLLARGISVDVRPLSTLEQFEILFEEFLTGLERARDAGCDLTGIHLTISVPLWLLDEMIAARLGVTARCEGWAVAVARLLYHRREQLMGGARWRLLVRAGARPPYFVWSSCEAPVREAVHYLEELVGWNSGFSAGPTTLRAVGGRAELRGDTVSGTERYSRRLLSSLRRRKVDLEAVGLELQQAQLEAVRAEWADLCGAVEATLKHV